MDEKILKFAAHSIYYTLLAGAFLYFMTFVFALLKEVSGFAAVLVVLTAVTCLCSSINVLKRM